MSKTTWGIALGASRRAGEMKSRLRLRQKEKRNRYERRAKAAVKLFRKTKQKFPAGQEFAVIDSKGKLVKKRGQKGFIIHKYQKTVTATLETRVDPVSGKVHRVGFAYDEMSVDDLRFYHFGKVGKRRLIKQAARSVDTDAIYSIKKEGTDVRYEDLVPALNSIIRKLVLGKHAYGTRQTVDLLVQAEIRTADGQTFNPALIYRANRDDVEAVDNLNLLRSVHRAFAAQLLSGSNMVTAGSEANVREISVISKGKAKKLNAGKRRSRFRTNDGTPWKGRNAKTTRIVSYKLNIGAIKHKRTNEREETDYEEI